MAALWLLMMVVWLGALVLGAWQSLPLLEPGAAAQDRVAAAMWLIIGGAAWVLTLNFGRRRFWPRIRRTAR